MVPPRNATQPPPAAGQERQVALEVADDGVDLEARVLGGDRGAALARSVCLADVEGHEPPERPAPASASSSSRVFSDVPEPSSTSVSAPVSAAILAPRAQDLPLARGWGSTRAAG